MPETARRAFLFDSLSEANIIMACFFCRSCIFLDRQAIIAEEEHKRLSEADAYQVDGTVERKMLLVFFERLSAAVGERLRMAHKSGSHVTAIIDFIMQHYQQDLYLENVSEQLGLSPKYVSRIFKEQTKMNISDYINIVRITKAQQLLRETSLPIQEIALLVGIPSRTTFLRVFRKQLGQSPREYRKQAQG